MTKTVSTETDWLTDGLSGRREFNHPIWLEEKKSEEKKSEEKISQHGVLREEKDIISLV